MKILVVGTGGREHALLWKLAQDAPAARLFCTAGNAGMAELAEPVPLAPLDIPGLVEWARRAAIDLTVVGPEGPLAAGIVDAFRAAGLSIFGPTRAAAEIESSKAFAKAFMVRRGIPTASFQAFSDAVAAERFLREGEGPIVVKASGLMAGKGAVVCESRDEAVRIAREMLRGVHGEGGRRIVVEDVLQGGELSVIAVTDGRSFRSLLPARDHKRALDGDQGPNTGGMGAIAPVPGITPEVLHEVEERIFGPTVLGLAEEGRPFSGALYAGLMLTSDGPRVVEFNARFGDPETQAMLPLLESSLLELLLACADADARAANAGGAETAASCSVRGRATASRLEEVELRWRGEAACCVVAASGGYPGAVERGLRVELGEDRPDALVFHAGTTRTDAGLATAGGRVLGVTGLGPDLSSARASAYARLNEITFPGMHFRRDIGLADAGDGMSSAPAVGAPSTRDAQTTPSPPAGAAGSEVTARVTAESRA